MKPKLIAALLFLIAVMPGVSIALANRVNAAPLTFDDLVFVNTLCENRETFCTYNSDSLVQIAHDTCQSMRNSEGYDLLDAVDNIAYPVNRLTRDESAYFVGAAVAVYCDDMEYKLQPRRAV